MTLQFVHFVILSSAIVTNSCCLFSATKTNLSKQFPNVSSESDLQRYRTSHSHERKSPSLSNQINSGNQKVCHHQNVLQIQSPYKISSNNYLLQSVRYSNIVLFLFLVLRYEHLKQSTNIEQCMFELV